MRPEELRHIRQEWGLSQAQMSQLLGCHVQTVSDMERGKNPISQAIEIIIEKEKVIREMRKLLNHP